VAAQGLPLLIFEEDAVDSMYPVLDLKSRRFGFSDRNHPKLAYGLRRERGIVRRMSSMFQTVMMPTTMGTRISVWRGRL